MASKVQSRPATITSRPAIDLLLSLIRSFPHLFEHMPAKVHARIYWQRILAPNASVGR